MCLRLCLLVSMLFVSGCSTQPDPLLETRRPLRVVLYPYIPEQMEFFYNTEQGFENAYPDIDLQIIDLSENYYDLAMANNIESVQADVYELDTVFLQEFVSAERIKVLPDQLIPSEGEFLESARHGSMINGAWYSVPHWLCGEFLFYLKDDSAIENASTLSDLRQIVTPNNGILIDFVGIPTLDELYLIALFDHYGDEEKILPYLTVETMDPAAVQDLEEALGLCPSGYCRNEDYHEAYGFYARQFARRKARGYVGYSESLYDLLSENENSCAADDHCVGIDDIAVKKVLLDDNGSYQVGWVDSLAIDAGCVGACEQDAIAFIEYYNDEATTLSALLPGPAHPPRYLLPARASLYSNKELTDAAPLYAAFEVMIQDAATFTGIDLPEHLNAISRKLNEILPDH